MHVWGTEPLITALAWSGLCGLLGLYCLIFRGTTLSGVYLWCWAAALVNSLVSWASWGEWISYASIHGGISQQFSAAVTLGPIVALLGAKRPQNKAWNWIVMSAILVLMLPALETWLYRSPRPLGVSLIRNIVPWAIVIIGTLNYLGTANYWRGLLAGAALSMPFLQGIIPAIENGVFQRIPDWVSPCLLICAVIPVSGKTTDQRIAPALGARPQDVHIAQLNSVWRRFRDWYGLAWSLHVLDRMSGVAGSCGIEKWHWGWNGFSKRTASAENIANVESSENLRSSSELNLLGNGQDAQYTAAARELRMRLAPFVNEEFFGKR